jgi:hypothetical protein
MRSDRRLLQIYDFRLETVVVGQFDFHRLFSKRVSVCEMQSCREHKSQCDKGKKWQPEFRPEDSNDSEDD